MFLIQLRFHLIQTGKYILEYSNNINDMKIDRIETLKYLSGVDGVLSTILHLPYKVKNAICHKNLNCNNSNIITEYDPINSINHRQYVQTVKLNFLDSEYITRAFTKLEKIIDISDKIINVFLPHPLDEFKVYIKKVKKTDDMPLMRISLGDFKGYPQDVKNLFDYINKVDDNINLSNEEYIISTHDHVNHLVDVSRVYDSINPSDIVEFYTFAKGFINLFSNSSKIKQFHIYDDRWNIMPEGMDINFSIDYSNEYALIGKSNFNLSTKNSILEGLSGRLKI